MSFSSKSRSVFTIGVLASALALSGCSLFSKAAPKPADLGPNVPVISVLQAWKASMGKVEGMVLEPRVIGETVTVASDAGEVLSLNARSGAVAWRVSLGTPLSAGVGSDGRWSTVVSKSNELIAIEGGREIWRKQLPIQVFTAPLVAGDRIFVLAADRSVYAYDAASGQRLWVQQRPGEALVLRQQGVLMPVGNTLVTGLAGRLVGFNPDNGSIRWEAPLASPRGTNDVERLVEIAGRTSRIGNNICARAFQTSVGCIDVERGAVVWTQSAAGSDGIDGDENAVYGVESNGTVIAWKRTDGAKVWSSNRLRYRQLTAPLVLGRSVVIGDSTGEVHMLAREDAAPLNRLSTDKSGVAAAPVAAAGTLVVVTHDGGIYGFRPE
ncbi:outer membrane protein assembly factor BamB [Diaphorobacter sp. HDW4A]|uniref:outer membrane protein assembly factor BamB n=1 Tax=Diaphorobacter sp. HDW4A TaxID=2714924 RepID=UPI00140A1557|nr:outer membrane protein assembly factor BamB [Diaphorobacter sp. HDW4A]QIL78865.1 outer membrane protein assembly factor BamB [Diaphorobacter sp. HDW4A]